MTPAIELEQLHYRWQGHNHDTLALAQLTLAQGEHTFIRGVSGSGKTTFLNLLAGILTPSSGSLQVLGQSFANLSSRQRDRFRADHIGVIFQQFNLLPYLSVLDNVLLPCDFSKRRRELAGDAVQSATQLLNQLGIPAHWLKRAVTDLSVGQQQRVAVARALMGKPELIIADEPTSALDAQTRDEFMNLLFQQSAQQHSTLIFVSHDASLTPRFARVIDLAELNQQP